ncbi:hypothetical protein CHUAL_007958 [Chamberlinius hualienensis]
MNHKGPVDKQDDKVCVLCCRKVVIYAVGECDHPVCYQCATRMRVLCKQNDCAICRKELSKLIFSNERISYRELQDVHFTLKDSRHKLYFLDLDIQKSYFKLLENRCQFCENQPTYASFHSLKDHVRKEHERHFCDLCIEHLMIFPFERKCYTRADLARHRRVGDLDDTSHRGHPLCEFCDARYLDEDELYKHLRREHFYCHFCDADGFHHYYSDYEYLRGHFRQDHFLCEEGDCINEKFTTVFRSEIDLKAHRSTTHTKNLSKAQIKQARTLELEFTIAPRDSHPQRGGGHSRGDRDRDRDRDRGEGGEKDDHRHGNRRGGGNHRRGDDFRNKRRNEETESLISHPPVPVTSPKIDMNDSQAFPSLNQIPKVVGTGKSEALTASASAAVPTSTSTSTSNSSSSGQSSNTMAQKLAKINRFSVGNRNMNGDDEFPALGPSSGKNSSSVSTSTSKSNPQTLWGTSSASVLLTSSPAPSGRPNVTKKTLTLKLNSKEEFPGLQSNNKRPSSVSFHMTHNVKPTTTTSAASNTSSSSSSSTASLGINLGNSKKNGDFGINSNQPVVTRVTSTQNITFFGPSNLTKTPTDNGKAVLCNENDEQQSSNGVSKTESGWYVLKKGKCTKTEEPVVGNIPPNPPTKDEFPELEKTNVKMRFREAPVAVQASSNVWKLNSTSTEGASASSTTTEPDLFKKSSKKKQKGQNLVNETGKLSGELTGKKKKKQTTSTFEKLKQLIETHSKDLLLGEDLDEENDEKLVNKAEKMSVSDENEKIGLKLIPRTDEDEWPTVGQMKIAQPNPTSTQTQTPPPGFHNIQQSNSVKPPPGFTKNISIPPPGFKSPLGLLNNGQSSQTSVTFTNSSGEDFTLTSTSVAKSHTALSFMPLSDFNERNKQLMVKIVQVLGGENDNFANFVENSRRFRRDNISAVDYYLFCKEILGTEQFVSIFSELLVLLPDINKQQELLSVYNEMKSCKKNDKSLDLFVVCDSCQQVLSCKDHPIHRRNHIISQ